MSQLRGCCPAAVEGLVLGHQKVLGGSPARRQPPNMETRDSQHGDKRQCLRTDNIVV